MADPQQPDASPGAAGGEAGAAKPSGGIKSYLPLIVVVVLMPVAAWVTLMVKSKMDKSAPAEEATTEETSHAAVKEEKKEAHASGEKSGGSSEKGKGVRRSKKRNADVPVPLTREIVAYQSPRPAEEGKPEDVEKFVVLDSKGEAKDVAQADKIVVNVAKSGGRAYGVGRFALRGAGDDFVQQVNLNRERLLDVATGTLSSKTLDEIETPGFRNLLRAELLALFNQVLGGNAVSEVVITELITQQ